MVGNWKMCIFGFCILLWIFLYLILFIGDFKSSFLWDQVKLFNQYMFNV